MSDLASYRSFPSSPQSVAEECLEIARRFLYINQSNQERSPRVRTEVPPTAHTQSGDDRNDESDQSPRVRRERIAAALLAEFVQHGAIHEVRVPGVDRTLFIVPSVTDVDRLAAEGISRGRIWTVRELADLLRSSATAHDFAAVALAKVALDADVVAVRGKGGL